MHIINYNIHRVFIYESYTQLKLDNFFLGPSEFFNRFKYQTFFLIQWRVYPIILLMSIINCSTDYKILRKVNFPGEGLREISGRQMLCPFDV